MGCGAGHRADPLRIRAYAIRHRSPNHRHPIFALSLWPERDTSYASSFDVPFALAPDGRSLAYVAVGRDSIKRLWIRHARCDRRRSRRNCGHRGRQHPLLVARRRVGRLLQSPPTPQGARVGSSRPHHCDACLDDGRRDLERRRRHPLHGRTRRTLAGLGRGGAVVPVTMDEGSHFWPQFIGDGRHFLYAAAIPGEIRLGSLTGEPSRVADEGAAQPVVARVHARAICSSGGTRSCSLVRSMKPRSNSSANPSSCSRAFRSRSWAACRSRCRPPVRSPCGRTLVARRPRCGGSRRRARRRPLWRRPRGTLGMALAPDAKRLAVSRRKVNGGADVWIRDLTGSTETTADIRWARLRTTMVRGRRPPRVHLDDEGAAQTADQEPAATNRRRRARRLTPAGVCVELERRWRADRERSHRSRHTR